MYSCNANLAKIPQFWLALPGVIIKEELQDTAFIQENVEGFDALCTAIRTIYS